ncbi:MAG TPA: ParB/RepB/Spo0J family partition protein [Solirubrobacterales bacterium]|jgi:ParB family chromosome partitioning protein|nr:ParB/RepB/Spo0J family partition protein [Solirubrobacterales bacterium]
MTTQTITPTLETEKIDVAEGFNARTTMEVDALERLSASIAAEGLIQPILVKSTEDGRATVVAGHRRLAAAKLAGIEQVPVTYYEGERARPASLVENLHREDLDPIDAARGLKAIAEEFALTTNKDIAAQVNMSAQWAAERLRLLKLPDGCQAKIASGEVPVEAERVLRKVAEVSPRIAECICEMAVRRRVAPGDFVRQFQELLADTAEGRFEDKPTMIDARQVRFDVLTDREERADLLARHEALHPYLKAGELGIRLTEEGLDAIRAAGCLIEHKVDEGGFYSAVAYVTDKEMAADFIRRMVERSEATAKKRAEEEAAWRERSGQIETTPEEQKDARKTEREKAKKAAVKARTFNADLGRNLVKRRGKGSRREHSLTRAKAVAALVLADNENLPARGLRLVLPQLQEVEVKTLKSGEERQKVDYCGIPECQTYIENRIAEARSADEVLELLADTLIAGLVADDAELPQSRRIHWWSPVGDKVKRLLASDIKAVRPGRRTSKD